MQKIYFLCASGSTHKLEEERKRKFELRNKSIFSSVSRKGEIFCGDAQREKKENKIMLRKKSVDLIVSAERMIQTIEILAVTKDE